MRRILSSLILAAAVLAPATARAALTCTVTFSMTDSVNVGALKWETGYVGAPGTFVGSADLVECQGTIVGLFASFNDHDATKGLTSAVVLGGGFSGPVSIAECTFAATSHPVAADFAITVTYAVHPNVTAVTPLPHVSISSIVCDDPPIVCGNGIPEAGEDCDDGNSVNTDTCTNSCHTAFCGDGVIKDGVEACDDGNSVNTDTCTNSCHAAFCGDGVIEDGVEACDDGNSVNTDACTNSCHTASCGDGFVEDGIENCDDANTVTTDACTATCEVAACGDGSLRSGVEACDDGNLVNGDGCDANCTGTACGNGIATSGEDCDDANTSNSDACTSACHAAVCGDGFVRSGVEECDDGGTADGDGCSRLCQLQQLCGDATGDGSIHASDALRILQRAVGLDVDCPTWICNVDGLGGVSASDALRILKESVGVASQLSCTDPASIVIRLTTATLLGTLDFDVDYQGAAGDLVGSGSAVHCTALQNGAEAEFDASAERVLSASVTSAKGIAGPGSLVRCEFVANANVVAADFAVSVLSAKDKNGNTIADPGLKVIPY